ncbi:integrator complex subunit 13 isoform X2 [Eurytemora carolleeae]|uniref:integrator complex subunit 13 isoform X2 n=1 Tax=Eurytemora carolleeae TaxID=1294199 RepID=UPI000C75E740|nr:integrator complex subunit 13 isoform X2 [Eurytemora carolleeae]|eukprot:XP_023342106.1 integrator complex subunit 13-like isoform X2 [Eurytemora affinis]
MGHSLHSRVILLNLMYSGPEDKNIRFVVARHNPEILNGWQDEHQNCNSIMTALAGVGRPSDRKYTGNVARYIVDGIELALESLCEPTPRQTELLENNSQVINRGRLIVITTVVDDVYRRNLLSAAQEKIMKINQENSGCDGEGLALNHVELVLVHTTPTGIEYRLRTEQDNVENISPFLSTLFYSVLAGPGLSMKLLYLCLKHYDLASTTVTGIPMKEEQNASSSANYDVELFHEAASHRRLLGDFADMIMAASEGSEYQTCKLKWCTPRGSSANELQHCSGTFRITPTEVNSRQSSCLTNFLLSGRSVMLEMQRRSTGVKTISHMLTSHGGEIFIHTLSSNRSELEEPPSISEGPGGRVTDYRINDLADLIKCNQLAPCSGNPEDNSPLLRSHKRLSRFTKVLPLTISSSTLFSMLVFKPLYAALLKENMLEDDLAECRDVIFAIISMENRGEGLPGPFGQIVLPGKKGGKKEEQYRVMWTELERFVLAHSDQSPRHQAVLECLMEVRQKPLVKKEDKVGLDVALRELDKFPSLSDSFDKTEGLKRSNSPHSPSPGSKKVKLLNPSGLSLLQIWRTRKEKEASLMHREFLGRKNFGDIAKLYLKMESDTDPGAQKK